MELGQSGDKNVFVQLEFLMYLVVLGMLLSMLFLQSSPGGAFQAAHALSTQFAESEWRPLIDDNMPSMKGDFSLVHDINDREDFFVWLEQIVLPQTFDNTDDDGEQYVMDHFKPLGGIVLRQQRLEASSNCQVPTGLLSLPGWKGLQCYPNDAVAFATKSFQGTETLQSADARVDMLRRMSFWGKTAAEATRGSVAGVLVDKPFQHQCQTESPAGNNSTFWKAVVAGEANQRFEAAGGDECHYSAQMAFGPSFPQSGPAAVEPGAAGLGYPAGLPYSISPAVAKAHTRFLAEKWLTKATRQVEVFLPFYNANLNVVCVVRSFFTFSLAGVTVPEPSRARFAVDILSVDGSKVQVLRIIRWTLWGFCAVIYIFQLSLVILKISKRSKWHPSQQWSWHKRWIDNLKAIFFRPLYKAPFFAFILILAVMTESLSSPSYDKFNSLLLDSKNFVEPWRILSTVYIMKEVVDWQANLRGFLCFIIIYVLIMELFPRLAEQSDKVLELKLVVEGAYTQGLYFILVILFLATVFAILGHCLFPIVEYSSISWALYSQMQMTFGMFDNYSGMERDNLIWAPIFFWVYTIIMMLLLLNLVIAVMGEAFEEAHNNVRLRKKFPMLAWGDTFIQRWLIEHFPSYSICFSKSKYDFKIRMLSGMNLVGASESDLEKWGVQDPLDRSNMRRLLRERWGVECGDRVNISLENWSCDHVYMWLRAQGLGFLVEVFKARPGGIDGFTLKALRAMPTSLFFYINGDYEHSAIIQYFLEEISDMPVDGIYASAFVDTSVGGLLTAEQMQDRSMAICEEYGILPTWDPEAQNLYSNHCGDFNDQKDGTSFLEHELLSIVRLITLVQCLVKCENARCDPEVATFYPSEVVMKHTVVRARMSRPRARSELALRLLENPAFTNHSGAHLHFANKRNEHSMSQVHPAVVSLALDSPGHDSNGNDSDIVSSIAINPATEAAAVQMEVDLGTELGLEIETAIERGMILTSDQKRRAVAAQSARDFVAVNRRALPDALLDADVVDDLLADLAELQSDLGDESD
jgi:hypothetical protein